jgi:ribosomal protein S18 acetylase RimI-like enzyme
MIAIRRARLSDAGAMGAVHVAAWRSTYPGILPDEFLAHLSAPRHAAHYGEAIRSVGTAVFVAVASGTDVPRGSPPRVVGFSTAGRVRQSGPGRLAEGEIETLYVLDDYRERGLGRALIRAAAAALADGGCGSAYVWVLRDNPSRWFYRRLGGRPVAESVTRVAGQAVPQTAFVWNPIALLLQASPQDS